MSGVTLTTLGSMLAQIQVGKADIILRLEVIRVITKDALLGSDFLNMTKEKLDYEN